MTTAPAPVHGPGTAPSTGPAGAAAILGFVDRLDGHAAVLDSALSHWAHRGTGRPDAHAREAANAAMDEIDAMLRELHTLRQALGAEMRGHDDATAVRVDAILAARRAAQAPADPEAWAFE